MLVALKSLLFALQITCHTVSNVIILMDHRAVDILSF